MPLQREQVIEAVRSLGSHAEAARQLGVSHSYVSRVVREHERDSGETLPRGTAGGPTGPRKISPTEARGLIARHGSPENAAAALKSQGVSISVGTIRYTAEIDDVTGQRTPRVGRNVHTRISVSLPPEIARRLAHYCRAEGASKSATVAEALDRLLPPIRDT